MPTKPKRGRSRRESYDCDSRERRILLSTKWSAEEQRDVAADVVQAIVEGINILILAKAWQRDQNDDEGGLHDKPSEGKG